jgi:RecB family exonuclease
MEAPVADFFEELAGAARPPDEKETHAALRRAFRENPFGSADYSGYWSIFADELKTLSGEYRERLAALGREESSWEAARRSEENPEIAFERVFIGGFSDATPVQAAFLRRIADRAEFIYQAEGTVAFSPVRLLASRLGQVLDLELPRPVPPLLSAVDSAEIRQLPAAERARIVLYALPSLAAEARQAKFESLRALSRGETALVVVPRSPDYIGVFSAVFSTPPYPEGEPIPHSPALARLVSDDPAVGLLKSLLQLVLARFGSYALSQFLLTRGAAALVLDDPRAAGEALRLLKRFLAEEFREGFASVREGLREWLRAGGEETAEPLEFLDRLRVLLAAFLDADALPWRTLAAETLSLFQRCCRLFAPGPTEKAIRSRVAAALEAMAFLAPSFRAPLPVGEFVALLKRHVFSDSLYLSPDPFRGVQLVHLLEARSIPADVIVICGMNEGVFPSALPARLVEEPFVREAMGMMTADRREALEELNFFSLALSASRVVLTRAVQTVEGETAESRFLTRLRLAGCSFSSPAPVGGEGDRLLHLLPFGPAGSAFASIKAAVEHSRPSGLLPGDLPDVVTLSSGRTGTLLSCPFRFRLELQGMEEEPEAQEDPDPRYQGALLHRVACGLWERVLSERGKWDRERLARALEEIGSRVLPTVPALAGLRLGLRCGGWRNFAGWIERLLADWEPRAWEKELRASLRLGSREIRLRGRADFLGRGSGGGSLVLDFKRKTIPGGSRIKTLAAPQLPFYSLCLALAGAAVTHLGYCSFLSRRGGFLAIEEEGLGESLRAAIVRAVEEIEAVRGFPIRPSEEACAHCPYPSVCRMEEKER